MIIVDTSIWVDHFRRANEEIGRLLIMGQVVLHPFVYGELLLGGVPVQGAIGELLREMPVPSTASPAEAAAFISWAKLSGTGVGYVDSHLLLSARMDFGGKVMTRDKSLLAEATRLGVAYAP